MLEGVLLGLLFALAAMVLNSVAGLLQSDATRRVSKRRPLVAQPYYLGGLLVDLLGWACTAAALRFLPVFAVQAVLGGSIALTALAARRLYGSALRPLDRAAVGACVLGLVLVAASAGGDRPMAVAEAAFVVLSIAAVLLAVATVLLWRGGRAWPLAIVADWRSAAPRSPCGPSSPRRIWSGCSPSLPPTFWWSSP